MILRDLIASRLRDLVADQHQREIAWNGSVQTTLPTPIESLSDSGLLDQYERFLWLKVCRENAA